MQYLQLFGTQYCNVLMPAVIIIIIIILAYFYCAAYTGMKVIESPTNCDRRCITKLVNSYRRVDYIWVFRHHLKV